MRISAVILAIALTAAAHADAVTLKAVLTADAASQANLLPNASFEQVADGQVEGWGPWDVGYETDAEISHSGNRSARCTLPNAGIERGIGYTVELNQTQPLPIVATAWSRAEDVSGSPENHYSLYLDLEYMDGTPLWGQVAQFDCGTHDWQKRTVTVVPPKPIRSVTVHGIFRNKTGTAWFDDFSLSALEATDEATVFDSVPVLRGDAPKASGGETLELKTDDGLSLTVERNTGALIGNDGTVSGFFWRDAASGSDFRQPRGAVQEEDGALTFSADDPELGLKLDARLKAEAGHITVHGTVTDLTGEDRAITVYFAVPMDAVGWNWFDDVRVARPIEAGRSYTNRVNVGAGASGFASLYPVAAVAGGEDACAISLPLDEPRIAGLGYDAESGELYAGIHLGLSTETRNSPSSADLSLAIYRPDPTWGFRAALARYYELFPQCFTKRNDKEGIWMPFTDVSTVKGWQDFGFQFHEGNNNVAFDDEADIDTYVYVEPVSHWLRMPEEMERTADEALALLAAQAAKGDRQSLATMSSAIEQANGDLYTHIVNAPWCDGALFYLNPLPGLLEDDPEAVTQWRFTTDKLWRAFGQGESGAVRWNDYSLGYEVAPGEGREGDQAVTCVAGEAGLQHGASQIVVLNQEAPANVVVSGWSRAEDVTGVVDGGYCVYVDLTYADGTPSYGHHAGFAVGTHDWEQVEFAIEPEQAITSMNVYALFRFEHSGRVWFDDLAVNVAGSDANLLANPGFEPSSAVPAVLDGIYIDSAEMGASTPNFRRDHWRYATLPLTFTGQGRVCQLTMMNSVEFAQGLATQLHDENRTLMANSTPSRFPWLAAWCDVMGTETNWGRNGEYTPQTDATLSYRRAMCYQRPYLLLLNTIYDDFPNEWVERYFKRAISYGIFPSMFSHNAATEQYWRRPNLYNRDRDLFKKYIPICQAIAAAGWEPVTNARADSDAVWVERFGGADGELYLTVFNSGDEPTSATITLDAASLGVPAGMAARDLVADTPVAIAGGTLTVNLAAEDLAVVRLR